MAFNISYLYEIIDNASGPLKAINQALETSIKKAHELAQIMPNVGGRTEKLYSSFKKVSTSASKASVAVEKFNSSVNGPGGGQRVSAADRIANLAASGAALYGVTRAFKAPIESAMSFESAMADVNKVMNFKDPDGLKKMGQQIKDMALRLPVSQESLAGIVAQGAQLGVSEENLAWFTEFSSKVSVAFDIMPEAAAESMSKISNALGIPIKDMEKVADTMNYLGNTGNVKERELVEAMQTGGAAAGRIMNLTTSQTLALSTAFIEQGISASEAGTRLRVLARSLTNTKNLTQALGADSAKSFEKIMKSNPQEAINEILLSIKSGKLSSQKAQELLGLYASDFQLLSKNFDKYQDTLQRANDVSKQAGGVQKEFQKRSETTANKLQILRNAVTNISINLGAALLPTIATLAEFLTKVASGIAKFTEKFPVLSKVIMAAVGGMALAAAAMVVLNMVMAISPIGLIVAGIAALAAAFVAFASSQPDFIDAMSLLWDSFKEIFNVLSDIFSPLGQIFNMFSGGTQSIGPFTLAIKTLAFALQILAAVVRVLMAPFALLTSLITRLRGTNFASITSIMGALKGTGTDMAKYASPLISPPANAGSGRSEVDMTMRIEGNRGAIRNLNSRVKNTGNLGFNLSIAQ